MHFRTGFPRVARCILALGICNVIEEMLNLAIKVHIARKGLEVPWKLCEFPFSLQCPSVDELVV